MMNIVSAVFKRYANRHATMLMPGFQLLDSSGKRFGHIDSIAVKDGRLLITGWAISVTVGLANNHQSIKSSPNIAREDVLRAVGDTGMKTPGFILEMPFSEDYTVFWSEIEGIRYINSLPQIPLRSLQRQQIIPFLRDLTQTLPACIKWFFTRDSRSVMRIKSALGLNTVPRSGQLDTLIFPQDQKANNDLPPALDNTGVTIVIPVYNAFDLLPDVLERVIIHTDLPWRLIIVDDFSSDCQVRPWLRCWKAALESDLAERVILIENDANLGFIRSVNRAFAAALPYGDHVILLNSDAFVPSRWASRLLRPMLEQDSVSTVTPMSNDAEIFNVPVVCQREQLLPGEADAIDYVASQFSSVFCQADAPTGVGFCMAMHIDFLRKFPELDTIFGRGYGEEVDWCQKVRKKGGRHIGLGGLFVEHRGGTSFGSAEKLKLIRKNSQVISNRYSYYDAEVQEFIRQDPLKTPRLVLSIAWAGLRQKGAVPIYLAHDMGGGAELYLKSRIKSDLKTDAAAVVIRLGGPSRWQVELHSAHGVTSGETNDTAFVGRLLNLLPVRRLVYSCAVGDPDPISLPEIFLSFASGPADQIEILMHDYFLLSPSYTLLGSDGTYHGVPAPGETDPAHCIIRPNGSKADLNEWRLAWGKLMERANRISVFSEDSSTLVSEAYPQVASKIMVAQHKLLTEVPRVQPGKPDNSAPVIGVLGNIGYQKGAEVLQKLSQQLEKSGKARLALIGNIDPTYTLATSAIVHGDYKVEDIPALISRYGISRWFIPSIWPETFSYTTHEALATGLPVFSFNLGAQGEAVQTSAAVSGRGGLIPLDKAMSDFKIITNVILEYQGKKRDAA